MGRIPLPEARQSGAKSREAERSEAKENKATTRTSVERCRKCTRSEIVRVVWGHEIEAVEATREEPILTEWTEHNKRPSEW